MRILVIEDHHDIAENIGDYLSHRGHSLDFALDGIGGLHLALTEEYDVVILDLMLPGMDGLTVCRRLRQEARREVPVLMLTARDTLPDKLAGFDAGTDDFLVKPFALQELEARLLALVRRRKHGRKQLRVNDLELDLGTLVASRQGQRLNLNPTGLKLLECLMEASPNLVRREILERALWGDDPPHSDALRTHIYALRRELDRPFDLQLLHTVHGLGFRLGSDE